MDAANHPQTLEISKYGVDLSSVNKERLRQVPRLRHIGHRRRPARLGQSTVV